MSDPGNVFSNAAIRAWHYSKAKDGAEIHGGSEVNHMALQLMSGDYQRVKSTLENAGIEVHGRDGDPHCIYFHDPDGHQLQLLMPKN